ncbi:MAG: AAA family ATPase, partial [Rubripirellula sp.]|nr:AAA family ATPase [Rubripirellula sp.]
MQSNDQSYTAPPFPAFPCTSRYIPLGSVEEAFSRICRSIDTRETISMIVGPPGTGKSLICRLLAERYKQNLNVVVLGETPIESRQELLNHLLHQLQLDTDPGVDPQLTLIDFLCGKHSAGRGLLILVDEAQSLTREVIEAIRMVTNIMREGEPCVCTVLCGGMKFDEMLVDASMDAFTQRIATRCYLHAMNADETRQYVCDTIQSCGSESAETITGEALAAVHHACSGIPRLVNQMLTQAIDCAAESDEVLIDETTIDRAWAQLQQLPSPIVNDPKVAPKATAIEFAELDAAIDFDPTPKANSDSNEETAPATEAQSDPPSDTEVEWEPVKQTAGAESNVFDAPTKLGWTEVPEDIVAAEKNGEFDPFDNEIDVIKATENSNLSTRPEETTVIPDVGSSYSDIGLVSNSQSDRLEVEPTANVIPTISAKNLFGEFDEEEDVAVGSGFNSHTKPVPTAQEDVTAESPCTSESCTAETCTRDRCTDDQATPATTHNASSSAAIEFRLINPSTMDASTADTSDCEAAYYGTSPSQAAFTNSDTELEDVLHQEIIGIGQMTESALGNITDDLTNDANNVLEWPEVPSIPKWQDNQVDNVGDPQPSPAADAEGRIEDFIVVT